MKKYLQHLDNLTGASRTLGRLQSAQIVGHDNSISTFVRGMSEGPKSDVVDGLGTAIGAAAGAVLWKQHRVLGAVGGASLGRNIPALFGSMRRHAMVNMSTTGAGVLGSLLFRNSPIVGFGIGWITANAVVYFGKYR